MAASSNESFGLKIATSFSIALAVLLLIAVYFLNSNYQLEVEKNTAATKKNNDLNTDVRTFKTQVDELRTMIGYQAIDDYDAAKAQMKKDIEALKTELQTMQNDIATSVADYQKKLEGKGADAAQFETLKNRAKELVDSFMTNPNPSYLAAITRLKELTINQARLSSGIALNYIDTRRDLELATKVNADMKKVIEDDAAKSKADLDAQIKKDEDARATLVATTQTQSEQLRELDSKLTNITNDLQAKIDKKDKNLADLGSILRDLRDVAARKEDVMAKPGGRITYVDYPTKTVRVSLNRSQGVRPLMRFTIFDKNSVGVTSDRPKAAIELTKVGDPSKGEYDSVGRIINTFEPTDPIRYNDYIYSVGWSYDHPQRFALIGKIDVNRDGKDDRGELIRMIEASGGIIEYDLPPPGVDRDPGKAAVARGFARLGLPVPPATGRAAGKISGLAFAYVIDSRPTLILNQKADTKNAAEDTAFLTEQSTASREARDLNVRPLPLEKLLNMLGYEYSAPIEGRREAFDRAGIKAIMKPKGADTPAGATPAPGAPAGGAVSPDAPK